MIGTLGAKMRKFARAYDLNCWGRGFSAIESLFMLVAIFAFTWICLGMLHKDGRWPFKPNKPRVESPSGESGAPADQTGH